MRWNFESSFTAPKKYRSDHRVGVNVNVEYVTKRWIPWKLCAVL